MDRRAPGTVAPSPRSLPAQTSACRRSLPAIVRNASARRGILLDLRQLVVEHDRVALELEVLEALRDVDRGHRRESYPSRDRRPWPDGPSLQSPPMPRTAADRRCRRWFGCRAPTSIAAMPPLEERLRLAELTMTALARPGASELPPKIGIHPRPACLVRPRDARPPAWRRRGRRPGRDEVGRRLRHEHALGLARDHAVVVLNDPETGVPMAHRSTAGRSPPSGPPRSAASRSATSGRSGPRASATRTPVAIIGAGVQGRSHLPVFGGVSAGLPGSTCSTDRPERAAALASEAPRHGRHRGGSGHGDGARGRRRRGRRAHGGRRSGRPRSASR